MRTEPRTTQTAEPAVEDPFLYDFERLRSIASEPIVKRGVAYFKEHRVTALDWDGSRIWATVEGSQPDSPYMIELGHDQDGEFLVQCDCPFDWEPVCKHAVAVLLAYAGQVTADSEPVEDAASTAIAERAKRGRTEVQVKHLSGEPWFGTWSAASIASTTHRKQQYTVQIRSLTERVNFCTCPDLAINQLGTCKHIEAVLHKLRKRRNYRQLKNCPPAFPFVYLAWDVSNAPQIRLQRTAETSPDLRAWLDRAFDSGGAFKGRLPEDFFRLADEAQNHGDILIGEDAKQFALRLAEDASHRLRTERIRAEISRFGNWLPGIQARLYPYQIEGIAFLAATGRALLADDMGLGKTLQAIGAASWLTEHADVARILVVCPASLKHQWAREIAKFTRHEARVIQGNVDARLAQYRGATPFAIVNYELLLRDLSAINEILKPDLLILDEAQRIKNWQTKIAATVKLIASRYAFVLTGTPLENRLEDLYSLLQVVDPRVLGPLWRYLLEFHITDDRGKVIGYRNLSELRRRIRPIMLRRDRALVREQLPERIEQRVDVPLSPKQKELHDGALSTAAQLAHIARRRPLTPTEQNRLLAALQQARMACNAAGLVDKETLGSPKLDELSGLLEDLCLQEGLKVVVFSQWAQMTFMVEQLARRMSIGCVRLHGGVATAQRGALLDRFRDDDATQLFISTDAGGVGLNLQAASALINLDMPWNPAVLEQRIARVHRLGQRRPVQIILVVAADSYEQRITALVQNKRALFDNVVDPEASEDVVGVSKKMLQTLVADLIDEPLVPAEANTAESVGEPAQAMETPPMAGAATAGEDLTVVKATGEKEAAENALVRRTIEGIQATFGPRIERILGVGGGLLVVLDRLDDAAEQAAAALSDTVPVALIEPHTLSGLQRLEAFSALRNTPDLIADASSTTAERVSPHVARAREKLRAAELLIEQQCSSSAIELLASALLSAAAAKADLPQALSAEEAPLWVYAEAVPGGILTPEQATSVVRAISLRNTSTVPSTLVLDVLEDTRSLVAQAG